MYMSLNGQTNGDNDMSILNVADQQNNESSPSSTSSLEKSNSTDGLLGGIIEVSDDNKDADEVEEEIQLHSRRSHMPLRRPHSHIFLMSCGHPAPPDRIRIKKWAANGRSWCETCNPLTTPNIIKGGNQLSGWRKIMEQLIEKSVFPLSVLNLNDTYVYNGNNGHDANLIPPTPNSPPFMLDLEVFLGIVCANDLGRLPLRALTCLRQFIHSDTRVIPFFEKIHHQTLCHFSVNLLETAIRLVSLLEYRMEEQTEQSEIAFRRSKTALQIFYQATVRVPFFRETICKHQLSQWLNLLRIEFLQNDIILSLLVVIKEMHAWFFHSDDHLYVRLLSDLLLLYSSPTTANEHRTFIINIFMVLFNTDQNFLYHSFRLMDRETFTELLSVLEGSLSFAPIYRLRDFDFNVSPKACLHPMNLAYCIELIQHIDRELSEYRALKFDVNGSSLTMLLHIIHMCASVRETYNEVLNKGSAISLVCGVLKALMFAQRELGNFLIRAQHLMTNNVRVGVNPANSKYRYETQQRAALKSRPIRQRIQHVLPKRTIKTVTSINYDNGCNDESVDKILSDDDQKELQEMQVSSTDDLQEYGTKTQHAFDVEKREWKLEKDEELPVDIQEVPQVNENGDEPRKKHARLRSGSLSSDSPIDGIPVDEQLDSIQVDDSIEMEESKQLLSPSDVSCSSSEDEAPALTNQRHGVRPPMAKVAPLLSNSNNMNLSNKNSCYEEMDEEEESDLEDSNSQTDSIFGPRSEILFGEYMAERTQDADISSLNEDELLNGLPRFRSIQPIYQMVITRNITQQLLSTLKQSTLKCIDNLCKNSDKNRLIAGSLDAIQLVLQCIMRQEGERSLMLQSAIMALRSLCLNCVENQERLLEITEGCSHFIDQQKLFMSMGVELDVDKNGKQMLVPLDKE